jgi:serpin B
MTAACASRKEAAQKAEEAARTAKPTAEVEELDREESVADETGVESERRRVGVEDLVRTNNVFAFDLLKSLPVGENLAVSPHGVASTLAIAQAGADGETADEIEQTLRVEIGERDLHRKFEQLHDELRRREETSGRTRGRGFRLRVATGVWYDDDVSPRSRFLRVANNRHFATPTALDFGVPKNARAAIDGRIADATGRQKVEVVPASVSELTQLLLTNAVQFDAPWEVPFERAATRPLPFDAPSGTRKVATMSGEGRFGYVDGDGFTLLELPYAGGQVAASVILPDENSASFDAGLTPQYFDWLVSAARQTQVDVRLPRFSFGSRHSLKPVLSSMGMPAVFDPKKADLSRVARTSDDRPFYLADIVHQGWIDVDEDGSRAAASATSGASGGAGSEAVEFHVDRPFLFVVRDLPTGAILFVARVVEP